MSSKSVKMDVELYKKLEEVARQYSGLQKLTQNQVFRIVLIIINKN